MPKTLETPLISFQAKVYQPAEGGDWLFLRLPQPASDLIPTRSMKSVEGTVKGQAFQVCVQPDSEGGHWFPLEAELVQRAAIQPGEVVDFEIAPMANELEPEVPADLEAALHSAPNALATWNATTATARRDWVTWMTQGRKAETRIIRLNKMMDMLSHGKKRVCCFDRSGQASKEFRVPASKNAD